MSKLQLSVAVGNYDRVRPLMDGAVQIDGVDPVFMNLPPEEIFFRAFRSMDFDICELSMSSFTVKTADGNCPYVGVPAFVSRAFRHNSIYVRRDRIKSPADLKGKRVGLPEYQLTACVWARIILEDDHGVKPSDVIWVRGGIEHAGRPEKITIKLPPGVRMEDAPEGTTISELLERGDIDAFIAPRAPSLAGRNNPNIGWLFSDPIAAGRELVRVCRPGGRLVMVNHFAGIPETTNLTNAVYGRLAEAFSINWHLNVDAFLGALGLRATVIESVNVPRLSSIVMCRKDRVATP